MITEEKLYDFVSTVVNSEMDENQRDIFSLEGKELVTRFLTSNSKEQFLQNNESTGLDFGFAPVDIVPIAKSVIELGTLLISCFTVYINYKKTRKLDDINSSELETELYDALQAQHVPPVEAKRLVKKYTSNLKKVFQ